MANHTHGRITAENEKRKKNRLWKIGKEEIVLMYGQLGIH
jgi:hypothetical protein